VFLKISAPVSGTDLGYLLLKNPARVHSFDLPFGKAHVFYPELTEERAAATLLLDIDQVSLVRGRSQAAGESTLDQYVNDRSYVSSSFLSVAMSRVFGTAMGGRSKDRQDLADAELDWTAVIGVAPCRDGEPFIRRLFEPLGYETRIERHALDERFPEWGEGSHYTICIRGRKRLQDLFTHIYVLVPVLDAEKHYWVGSDEVTKLLRKGEGWLAAHPEREAITARYLRYDRRLTRDALARLADEDAPGPEALQQARTNEEVEIERPMLLWEQRIGAVLSVLRAVGAKSIVDLGCGEGKLLKSLLQDKTFERLVGMDVSWRSLEIAHRRLYMDQMPDAQRKRIELMHGSLVYRDKRLEGLDAAAVIEAIEHLDSPRLAAFERVLFDCARPKAAIVTTPNSEYNVKFATLPNGQFRHKDHRFEWSRHEFSKWAHDIAERFGYAVRFLPIGPEDPVIGPPTQMGVFTR
jgi:3' terminal RNA ribose 2'-O-methyltransferase Hen1